jgi:hypothetical protein
MTPHGSSGGRVLRRSALFVLCAAAVTAGCSSPAATAPYPVIDGEQIRTHHAQLDAARAAGIEPGGRGEQAALQYLSATFTGIGLTVQTQPVRLTKVVPTSTSLKIGTRTLRPGDDVVMWTRRHVPAVAADAPIVFVGYGISTPRQGWDDYKDTDVKDKMLLMLIGSPHNGKRDLLGALGGDWYGRRRYKFEEARRRGAAGVFLIAVEDQLDEPADLSWEHVRTASTKILGLGAPEDPTSHLAVEGWMTPTAARELFHDAGMDFDEFHKLAAQTNFKPIAVPLQAAAEIRNDISTVSASNLVATLKGTIPENVLYSAQWNDLPAGSYTGSDLTDTDAANQPPPGAPILLEVARALSREKVAHRTFVFLIVTAESGGLPGLDYYLQNPVYPLPETRAAIHMAGFSVLNAESQISIIGAGFIGLKELVHEQAAEQFRVASADTDRERLHFFRPAEAIYTEKGIPSVFLASRHAPEAIGAALAMAPPPKPDMSTAVLDAQLLFHVGLAVATSSNWPKWKPTRAPLPPGAPVSMGTGPPGGLRR